MTAAGTGRLSLAEIARMEERRQAVGTAEVAAESIEVAGGIACFDGPGSWANQACGMGLDGPVDPSELDRLVDFYTSRGVEPRVELCPFADPTVVRGLADRAFVVREFENVLARELRPGEDHAALLPHGWPDGLVLERVDPDDEASVREHVELAMGGFAPGGEPMPEASLETWSRTVRHARCDAFTARMHGEPAGAGSMEVGDACAALFGTSVLPEFRRRGIQAALMARRLQRAAERRARIACIHSTPGIPTERNALRLGFFGAYSKAVLVRPGEGLLPSP